MERETGPRDVIYQEITERFWVLRQVTEVRDDGVYVRLGPIQRSFRRISSEEIATVQVTTYEPATYDGWHWGLHTSSSGNTVYRLRGDQGVELNLTNGKQVFIGSAEPSELKDALDEARN